MKPESLPSSTEIPALPSGAKNPLKEFQTKSEPMVSNFRAMDFTVKSNIKEIESRAQWLVPDKVDPHFGIKGDTREVMIRRSYRRLESATLFKPATGVVSLSEIVPLAESPTRKLILVEESRVNELARLESILRDEQHRLGEQAAGVMSNYHIDARVPIPATRMAVQNLAGADQRGLQEKISTLHVAWHNYIVRNNYDRLSAVHNRASYVDRGPAALRALKLSKLVESNREKVLMMERDSMMFEDDLSYLNGAYSKAQERVWDYDRYYVLANRYGYMSEDEYYKDDRPGRRYYLRAVDGALKFQGIWGMYWAIQKMRYRKGATGFQKIIRGFLAWRKYHPLIIFRLKYGKRSYYEFCMHRWKKYREMLRMCKTGIQWLLDREWIHKTFGAWKLFREISKSEKFRKAKQIFAKVMSAGVYKCFQALKGHALRQRYIKIKMRRTIGFPQFDMWCDYVDLVKHQKKINKAASKVASIVRMFKSKRVFKAKKRVGKVLGLLIRCRVITIRKRKQALGDSFKLWEMLETERLTQMQTAAERKRLQKVQERITDLEKEELVRLRRHLKGGYGKLQLKQAQRGALRASKAKELALQCEQELKNRTSHVVKSIARHDLNLRDPPFLRCVDPKCRSTFVNHAQYHLHHAHNPRHRMETQEHKANFTRLMLKANEESLEKIDELNGKSKIVGHGNIRREEMIHLQSNQQQEEQKLLRSELISRNEVDSDSNGNSDNEDKEMASAAKAVLTSVTNEERLVITVSDFHLLLIQPACREKMVGSFTRLMTIMKPVKLQRQDETLGKKSLAQIMAEMDSDSDEGSDKVSSKSNLLGSSALLSVNNNNNDDEEEDDDDELISLIKAKEREDPVTRNLKNAVQLYAAIQEWRRQPSDSYQYKVLAMNILDKYLVDPEPLEEKSFEPTEELEDFEEKYDLSGYWSDESNESYDTVIREEKNEIMRNRALYRKEEKRKFRLRQATITKVDFTLSENHTGAGDVQTWLGLPELILRLKTLKESTHKGFLKPMRMPRNCIRMVLGMQGRPYKIWTDEGVLPGDFFDRLEFHCFQLLYQYVTHSYFNFHGSPEYTEYLSWKAKQQERRLFDMYVRAKDLRLKEFEKWSREVYYPKHMAIYRTSDQVVDRMVVKESNHLTDYALQLLVSEQAFLVEADLQERYEHTVMLALEAVDWSLDDLFNEWWDIYVDTAVKSMLEIDLVRGKLMEFAGLREKSNVVKKKLLVNVDMTATSGSLLDMLNDDPVVPEPLLSGEDGSKSAPNNDSNATPHKGKGNRKGKEMQKRFGASGETKEKDDSEEKQVPAVNVINVSTSNHSRWQANKANKKSAAIREGKIAGHGDDLRGPAPKPLVSSEKHWDSLVTVQRLFRGILARNRARREFAHTFVKKWDAQYGACYYANVNTEEASWEPPAIYAKLYPGKMW